MLDGASSIESDDCAYASTRTGKARKSGQAITRHSLDELVSLPGVEGYCCCRCYCTVLYCIVAHSSSVACRRNCAQSSFIPSVTPLTTLSSTLFPSIRPSTNVAVSVGAAVLCQVSYSAIDTFDIHCKAVRDCASNNPLLATLLPLTSYPRLALQPCESPRRVNNTDTPSSAYCPLWTTAAHAHPADLERPL